MVYCENGPAQVDELILQIFEEQEDSFYFPVRGQKSARAFVKALHTKGLAYESLQTEIGEFEHNFSSWRKGLGRSGIGLRVIERINQPLQQILDEDEDKLYNSSHIKSRSNSFLSNHGDRISSAENRLQRLEEKKRELTRQKQEADRRVQQKQEEQDEDEREEETRRREEEHREEERRPEQDESEKRLHEQQLEAHRGIGNEAKNKRNGAAPAAPAANEDPYDILKRKLEAMKRERDARTNAERPRQSSSSDEDQSQSHRLSHDTSPTKVIQSAARNGSLEQSNPDSGQESPVSAGAVVLRHVDRRSRPSSSSTSSDKEKRSSEFMEMFSRIRHSKHNSSDEEEEEVVQHMEEQKSRVSTPKETIPKDSPPKGSPPQDSLPKDVPPKDSLPSESLPKDSLPSESLPKSSPPKGSLPKESPVRESPLRQSPLRQSPSLEHKAHSSEVSRERGDTEESEPDTQGMSISKRISLLAEMVSDGRRSESESMSPPPAASEGAPLSRRRRSSSPPSRKASKEQREVEPQVKSSMQGRSRKASEEAKARRGSEGAEDWGRGGGAVTTPACNTSAKESKHMQNATQTTTSCSSATPAVTSINLDASTAADENYNSDLDPDNADQSPVMTKLVQKIGEMRARAGGRNSRGYIYVFTDTQEGDEGEVQVKVGISRCVDKRLSQARQFNPSMRRVACVGVAKRVSALAAAQDALHGRELEGAPHGWYSAHIAEVTEVVATAVVPFVSKTAAASDAADDESST